MYAKGIHSFTIVLSVLMNTKSGVASCCRNFHCKIEIELRLHSLSLKLVLEGLTLQKEHVSGQHEIDMRQSVAQGSSDLRCNKQMPYRNILGCRCLDTLQMHSTKLIITGFITMLLFSRFCGILLLFFVYSVTNYNDFFKNVSTSDIKIPHA